MRAISFNPLTDELFFQDRAEPHLETENDVKLKVLEVGICGTDREEVAPGPGRAIPPPGEKELILGHEMIGEVVEVGARVKSVKKGDLAIVTVRRSCTQCSACQNERADMCETGNYLERGIKGLHGFLAEYVIEREEHIVKASPNLREVGVLTEPLSVVEKALDEILNLQRARLPDWKETKNKKALVAGLGPIGLLACFALRLRNFQVFGLDIVESTSPRTKILQEIGGTYIDGRNITPKDIPRQFGQIDLIFEAVGIARIEFDLFSTLGINGAYILTGVPLFARFEIEGGKLVHDFVLKNQLALGSVNASKKHWEMAVQDLKNIVERWPQQIQAMITSKVPYEEFEKAVTKPAKEDIKTIITFSYEKNFQR